MLSLSPAQWALAAVSAAGIGLSKTGIPGLGIVAVALFAITMPSKESVGVVLPLLIVGDFIAVGTYRRHAVWSHLFLLVPWAAVGIVLGYFAMGHIDDSQIGHLIGALLIVLVVVQVWRQTIAEKEKAPASESSVTSTLVIGAQAGRGKADSTMAPTPSEEGLRPTNLPFAIVLGVLAGFSTMVANAAGPIMILYLLTMRLPKLEFIGTAAWYYMVLNLFKVPFSWHLGLINSSSAPVDLVLAPFVIAGCILGRVLLPRIDQALFERLALGLTVIAALKLVL